MSPPLRVVRPVLWALALAAGLPAAAPAQTRPVATTTVPATRPAMTDDVLSRLAKLPPHPRLILDAAGETRLRAALEANPDLRDLAARVRNTADTLLTEPVLERRMTGRRLLFVSREALRRTLVLSLAYRLTGSPAYADRARRELLAVAAFSDWNPSHFLDVAEMAAAVSLGLDWLHPTLSEDDRGLLRRALIDKALRPSFAPRELWFFRTTNNWNQVCNGGLVLAALSVAGDEPELASKVIARAIQTLPISMREYGPDGAYPEGPGYWEYGTTYNAIALSALQTALGTDFGLADQPGFSATADYFLHATGPTGLFFNYADCGQRPADSAVAAMFFFAARRGDASTLLQEREFLRRGVRPVERPLRGWTSAFTPLLLAWAADAPPGPGAPPPTHFSARGSTPVAMFRSSWRPDAAYAAIKGGSARTSHGHMDAATFVLDLHGVRWAEDLGMQDYESLESRKLNLWDMKQTGQRWTVYRLNNTSHNVLTVNGQHHRVEGSASLDLAREDRAVIEATTVYGTDLASHRRGIRLLGEASVLLQDELASPADRPAKVRWQFLTRAAVTPTPTGWTLQRDGKTLHVTVVGVNDLTTTAAAAKGPEAHDAPNPGVSVASFDTTLPPGTKATWRVTFSPTPEPQTPLHPLSDW